MTTPVGIKLINYKVISIQDCELVLQVLVSDQLSGSGLSLLAGWNYTLITV